jgi:anaerobic magnesium-protoporphyrin IX monomethyl ester cyclase
MQILLINPPAQQPLKSNIPQAVDEERGPNPPIGLLYVAAAARQAGHQVSVIDGQLGGMDYRQIAAAALKLGPRVVGIQALTFNLLDVLGVVEAVKRVLPEVRIVLGGPHVWLYPEESARLPGVDYCLLGEGEANFPAFLEAIEGLRTAEEVPGLVWLAGDEYCSNGLPELITDLDSLAHPARELTPVNAYYSLIVKRRPVTLLISSRGCPYLCTYCYRPHLGKKFRARSAKNVVEEIEQCISLGIREFLFYDDTFDVERERVLELCRLLTQRKLDIGFDVRVRVDRMDEEVLTALKEAGCERIHYGVEAADQRTLRRLKKGIELEKVPAIFELTHRLGLTTLAYFMLGSPGETRQMVEATIDYAIKLDSDYAHFSVTTPFPGTELYAEGLKLGVFKRDYWAEFAARPSADFVPPLWEERIKADELAELLALAYRRFYLRPGYMWKRLKRVRRPRQLVSQLRAGLKVFGMK